MTTLSLVQDAAFPQQSALQPGVLVTAGYIGGDALHVWDADDWAHWGTRWRVPIWVRDNAGSVDPVADGQACVAALGALGAPGPYLVMPYGSTGSLFQNPEEDGYWPAVPNSPAPPVLWSHPGVGATQFALEPGGQPFDLSVMDQAIPTWDTEQGTGPTVVMLDLETAVAAGYVTGFAAVLHAVTPPGYVQVPTLLGRRGNAALAELEAAGLAGVIHCESLVVSQTPAPGVVVAAGSNVNLGA